MKRNSLPLYLAPILIAAFATGAAEMPEGAVLLGPQVPPVDIGRHFAGDIANITVPFTNLDDSPATIKSVKSSCPCVKVTSENLLLQPGQSINLAVEIDGANLKGDFSGLLMVLTERDGRQYLHRIPLSGNFRFHENRLVVSPSRLTAELTSKVPCFSQVYSVTRSNGEAVGTINVTADDKSVILDTPKPHGKYTVHFSVERCLQKDDPEQFSCTISIQGSTPEDVATVRVILRREPLISLQPPTLLMTQNNQAFSVTIKTRDGLPLPLLHHSFTSSDLTLESLSDSPATNGKPRTLELTLTRSNPQTAFPSGKAELAFGQGDNTANLTLPIVALPHQ